MSKKKKILEIKTEHLFLKWARCGVIIEIEQMFEEGL